MPRREPEPDDDPVRWVVRQLVADGMPRDAALLLELQLRDEFGGQYHYVRTGPPRRLVHRVVHDRPGGTSNC